MAEGCGMVVVMMPMLMLMKTDDRDDRAYMVYGRWYMLGDR